MTKAATEPSDRPIEVILAELGIRTDVAPGTPALTPGPGKCNPYKPVSREAANGEIIWSASFRHPISGAQTAKVYGSQEDAWGASKLLFDLWVRNGRPSPNKRPEPSVKGKGDVSQFDPVIGALWGSQLTVTMVGIDEHNEPIMALRQGKRTFIVNVKGYQG